MVIRKSFQTLVLVLALGGCAGEDGEAGSPGGDASCSVDAAGTEATITCSDGTSTTVGGGCSVASNGDGTHTITCPTGTTIVKDGEQLERGTITGSIVRFGLPPTADAQVTVVELDRTAHTDASGAFTVEGVPPGAYTLRFSHPGYQPLQIPNVIVFGGLLDMGPQVLQLGMKLGDGYSSPFQIAGGTRALLLEGISFPDLVKVSLFDFATGEKVFILDGVVDVGVVGESCFGFVLLVAG